MKTINGNTITDSDVEILKQMHLKSKEIQNLYVNLSGGCQSALLDLHTSDTWVGHCVRWLEQNTEESINQIEKA